MGEEIYYHNDHVASSILLRCFRKYLKGHVLEVGAGIGCVTKELAKFADHVTSLEPNQDLFESLRSNLSLIPNVRLLPTDTTALTKIGNPTSSEKYDVILYVNVLEHIQSDADEIRRARSLLRPNGVLLIVVPAHQVLYSKIDRLTGHYRRYSKKTISSCLTPHFNSIAISNFDSVGLLPYLLVYRILGSSKVSGVQAELYSRIILRLSYLVYRVSGGRIIGKNFLVVAR